MCRETWKDHCCTALSLHWTWALWKPYTRGLRTAIIPNQMPHQPGSSGLLRVTFNIFEVFKDIFTLQTNSDASNDRNKHIK